MQQRPLSFERIAIVGAGKMGEAILAGLLSCGHSFTADSFVVVNPGIERRRYIEETYRVECFESVASLPPSTFVLLAVKPQVFPNVLPELAACSWVAQAHVASIAAGITTSSVEEALPQGVRVVRIMPNLGLTIGHGASAVCAGRSASSDDAEAVRALFALLGHAVVVEEFQMDAVCAVSGSGPAYVAALAEAIMLAGIEEGLSPENAETLTVATIEGTGALLSSTNMSAAQLRRNVSSPGGTTLAALDAMERAGYSASITAGVRAAVARSKELSL